MKITFRIESGTSLHGLSLLDSLVDLRSGDGLAALCTHEEGVDVLIAPRDNIMNCINFLSFFVMSEFLIHLPHLRE